MKRLLPWGLFLGLGGLGLGCSMVQQGARNLVVDPLRYPTNVQNIRLARRSRLWAESAWAEVSQQKHDPEYSLDYVRGFKDGFADYVQFGGNGEPPPVPPRDYWRGRYQNEEGQQAMQDWFAGFRHGVAAAQNRGLREQVTVPLALPFPPEPILLKASEPEGKIETLPAPNPLKQLPLSRVIPVSTDDIPRAKEQP